MTAIASIERRTQSHQPEGTSIMARPEDVDWARVRHDYEHTDKPTAERLQGAVVAVLANIEAIVAKVATGRAHASENERAARALAALTRTLRELKSFPTHPQEPQADDPADDIDEFRRALARKIDA